MRGYGMPQASFADDANIDECAKAVGMEPLEYRMKYIMPKGFHDGFSGNTNYYDSFRECLEKGKEYIEYDKKREEYAKDIGPVRRGIGVAVDVDEARGHPPAPGVDDPGGPGGGQRLHGGDFTAGHRHVRLDAGTAGAVIDGSAPDDQIKHEIPFFCAIISSRPQAGSR